VTDHETSVGDEVMVTHVEEASDTKEDDTIDPRNEDLKIKPYFNVIKSGNFLRPETEKSVPEILQAFLHLHSKYGKSCSDEVAHLITAIAPETKQVFALRNLLNLERYSADDDLPDFDFAMYCSKCLTKLQPKILHCTECKCVKSVAKNEIAYCLVNDLKKQLKFLFESVGLAELLEGQKLHRESKDNILRDVRDGLRYKTLPRTSKYDLSFIHGEFHHNCNYIGPTHSEGLIFSNMYAIAEFDPELRNEFLLVADIWFYPAETIPDVAKGLEPMKKSLQDLGTKGLEWIHPVSKEKVTSKVFLLLSSIQHDIRCDYQHLNGCSFCEHPGVKTKDEKDSLFPFQRNHELRTHGSLMQAAVTGLGKGEDAEPVNGVYAVSPMAFLPYFNLVEGFASGSAFDLFASGPIANHLRFLFNKKKKSRVFFTEEQRDAISARIKSISKTFRSFLDQSIPSEIYHVFSWTFRQQLCWFLFYAVPCLDGILNAEHLEHYYLFIKGVYNLVNDEVSPEAIKESERLLEKFCEMAEELYGRTFMDIEIHGLQHFAQNALQCGPFWCSTTPLMRNARLLQENAEKLFLNLTTNNFLLFFLKAFESYAVRFDCHKHLKVPVCLFIGVGEEVCMQTDCPKWMEKSSKFYSKANIRGVMYDISDPGATYFMYESKKEFHAAQAVKFCKEESEKEFVIAKKVHFLEPKYKSEKLDVVVDFIRPFKVDDDSEGLIFVPVKQVRKPLFLGDNMLFIPPMHLTSDLILDT